MKKIIAFLIILVIGFIGFSIYGNGVYNFIDKDYAILNTTNYNGTDINMLDNYKIDLEFNPDKKYCSVVQEVKYINKEDKTLNKIYFHIYPNAFRENRMYIGTKKISDEDYIPGYIEFKSIKVNGENVGYNILGSDQTLLEINLNSNLDPKDYVNVFIEYELKIPKIEHRFGYGSETYNFGNWYPIAVVYDKYGWNLSKYYQIGDPFYSDVSNYFVNIKAPKEFIIASSGKILSVLDDKDNKIWNIEGKLIRDFAWVASDKFTVETHNLKNTQIKLYFLTNNNELKKYTEKIAGEAVNVFNNVFGQYPYGYLSIVENNFLGGGMEYPGLVYLNKYYFDVKRKTYLSEYIVHELAHQWWYGVVGNNQIKDPWLDEGLATYSQIIFNNEYRGYNYGASVYRILMDNYNTNSTKRELLSSVDTFSEWDEYSSIAYGKGAMFLHNIKEKYGEEKLYEILKEYYDKYRFKNAASDDFLNIYEEKLGVSY